MQRARKDRTGERHGRLVILSYADGIGRGDRWVCRCDCGTVRDFIYGNLQHGRSTSCGCWKAEWLRRDRGTDAAYAEVRRIWSGIKQRCFNEKQVAFKYYGGRGIGMFPGWVDDFDAFYRYMGPRPSPDHSIDRLDPNRGYEPGNCRWATPLEQGDNRRNNRDLTVDGQTFHVAEWARRIGLSRQAVDQRLRRGETPEQITRLPRAPLNPSGQRRCSTCGELGHFAKTCGRPRRRRQRRAPTSGNGES